MRKFSLLRILVAKIWLRPSEFRGSNNKAFEILRGHLHIIPVMIIHIIPWRPQLAATMTSNNRREVCPSLEVLISFLFLPSCKDSAWVSLVEEMEHTVHRLNSWSRAFQVCKSTVVAEVTKNHANIETVGKVQEHRPKNIKSKNASSKS